MAILATMKAALKRADVRMWVAGEVFILIFCGLVMGIGAARGWWAPSGDVESESNSARFLPEPKILGNKGEKYRDNGFWSQAYWYYWQTKPEEQTWWGSHMIPWLGYVLHQGLVWVFLYRAQKQHTLKYEKPHQGLRAYNWQIFATNVIFYVLHLGQTHWTYDGLAVDVIITSGLSSVSTMIAFVFCLEFHDRGLLFGWPQKHHDDKWGWAKMFRKITGETSRIVRKYHGYMFTWINIFTFWYHPLENTYGHMTGMFLIWQFLLQSSLVYTEFHLVKPWRFFVEICVIFHGPSVAYQMQMNQPEVGGPPPLWPLFLYGFAFAFILTSMFTMDLLRKLPWYIRPLPWTVFMIWVFIYYEFLASADDATWHDAIDACKIPAILYFTMFTGYFTMEMFHWATVKMRDQLNHWIWFGLAWLMVALFTLLSILSYQLEWTKSIDFPVLSNKLWTPTNGILMGMFLVFVDNHFYAWKKSVMGAKSDVEKDQKEAVLESSAEEKQSVVSE